MSSLIVKCDDPAEKASGLEKARDAILGGHCVVMPTDTVYGIACDAFSPEAVAALLATKGRGRSMPPPVLVGEVSDVDRLVAAVPEEARAVMASFWPGAVTIIFRARPELVLDLGDRSGTVAIRMPNEPVALELLRMTGPLAVSSANKSGAEPAFDSDEAFAHFGDEIGVYLDAGRVGQLYPTLGGNPGSTIIDATALSNGGPWRVIRYGVVPIEQIRQVSGGEWEL